MNNFMRTYNNLTLEFWPCISTSKIDSRYNGVLFVCSYLKQKLTPYKNNTQIRTA